LLIDCPGWGHGLLQFQLPLIEDAWKPFYAAQEPRKRFCFVHNIEEVLLDQFEAKFGSRPSLDDDLVLLGVDSVGMAELTFELEKTFKIRVDDSLLEAATVDDLVKYIKSRQS
jgi:acyl carrier protein